MALRSPDQLVAAYYRWATMFNRSYVAVAAHLGVSEPTARRWVKSGAELWKAHSVVEP